MRLSLRADGVLATASSPDSPPISDPAVPRMMDRAYGFRFCGISTLARLYPSASVT